MVTHHLLQLIQNLPVMEAIRLISCSAQVVTFDTSMSTTSLYCRSQAVEDSIMADNLSTVSVSEMSCYYIHQPMVKIQCNSSSNRSPYRIQCNSSSNRSPYRIQCNSSSNRSPYRIQCNSNSNRSPYRIQCNSSSNRSPYRIQCNGSSNRSSL